MDIFDKILAFIYVCICVVIIYICKYFADDIWNYPLACFTTLEIIKNIFLYIVMLASGIVGAFCIIAIVFIKKDTW